MPTETVRYADVVLPACAPPERTGSFTSWEGRRQAWPQSVAPPGPPLPDWDILAALARELDVDLHWETAADVRREAGPLLTLGGPITARLGAVAGDDATPPAPPPDGSLHAVVLPYLLGRGTLLTGAKELLETARPAAAWLHPDDAAKAGVVHGQTVTVRGPGGVLELLAKVTELVVPGCVVIPANSTETVPGELAAEGAERGAPLHVTVTPGGGA